MLHFCKNVCIYHPDHLTDESLYIRIQTILNKFETHFGPELIKYGCTSSQN